MKTRTKRNNSRVVGCSVLPLILSTPRTREILGRRPTSFSKTHSSLAFTLAVVLVLALETAVNLLLETLRMLCRCSFSH